VAHRREAAGLREVARELRSLLPSRKHHSQHSHHSCKVYGSWHHERAALKGAGKKLQRVIMMWKGSLVGTAFEAWASLRRSAKDNGDDADKLRSPGESVALRSVELECERLRQRLAAVSFSEMQWKSKYQDLLKSLAD
jgi:hypothetical protein